MGSERRDNHMLQEAAALAQAGALGNAQAVRLLQLPHTTHDIQQVLGNFNRQLTPQAKSKLTLEALSPLPQHVDNQRFEALFEKYPISGKTYTTASGTVVPIKFSTTTEQWCISTASAPTSSRSTRRWQPAATSRCCSGMRTEGKRPLRTSGRAN